MQGIVNNMKEVKLKTLVQIKAFLDGASEVAFRVPKEGRNQFVERVLKQFGDAPHGRASSLPPCTPVYQKLELLRFKTLRSDSFLD